MTSNIPRASFITFFSFKGGVGRSMALINTAAILAVRGFRVLVLDLDLEAPGLTYLTLNTESNNVSVKETGNLGFIDLMLDAKERGEDSDLFSLTPAEINERYTRAYPLPDDDREVKDGTLRIMPAGRLDDEYALRFDTLDLGSLYRDGLGEPLIRSFKQKFANSDLYDYVLIDSRTGFSDEAGICTRDLADHLIILSGLNRQNIEGTSEFLRSLRIATNKTSRFQIVLSPVPNGEDKLMEEREKYARQRFKESWGSEIDLTLQIPYHPQLSLTEEPHIFRRRRGYLFDAYSSIEKSMLASLGHDAPTLKSRISAMLSHPAPDYAEVLRDLKFLVRLIDGKSALADIVFDLTLTRRSSTLRALPKRKREGDIEQAKTTMESLLSNEIGRLIVDYMITNLSLPKYDSSARLLIEALETEHADSNLNRISLDLADRLHQRRVDIEPKDALNADAFFSYAVFLEQQRRNFDAADAMYQKALEIDLDNVIYLSRYGTFLENKQEDIINARKIYRKRYEIEPDDIYSALGYALFLEDKCKDSDAAEAIYIETIRIDPQSSNGFCNYANFLGKVRRDYESAERMFKKAFEIEPESAYITSLYGIHLDRMGSYELAEEMYKKAWNLDPEDADNIAYYADFLATRLKDIDAAEEKFKESIKLDPSSSNNFDLYANFLAYSKRDYTTAERIFEDAMELDPLNINVRVNFSALLLVRGEGDDLTLSRVHAEKTLAGAVNIQDQACAEALLYLCLNAEITNADVDEPMARLKALLHRGYVRGNWDFGPIFDIVLPKISADRAELYRALGEAITSEDKVANLDKFEEWRTLEMNSEILSH